MVVLHTVSSRPHSKQTPKIIGDPSTITFQYIIYQDVAGEEGAGVGEDAVEVEKVLLLLITTSIAIMKSTLHHDPKK